MQPLALVLHPRSTAPRLAGEPDGRAAALVVLGSGVVAGGLGAAAAAVSGAGRGALAVSGVLPLLFAGYWLLEAYCVDSAAAMLGSSGRRPTLRAVTAYTFPAWLAYALLGLVEAVAARYLGAAGGTLAGGLQWLTLPVLAWFILLSIISIREVYGCSLLNAFAFALLPYALLSAAVLVLGVVLGALHNGGVV